MENLWQSSPWACLQKSLGNTVFFVEDILLIQRKLPLGKTLLEIPRACPTEKQWHTILQEAKQRKSIAIRIAPNRENTVLPKGFFALRSASQRFPEYTRIIPLSGSEEEIFSGFSSTGRRHIRQAEKNSVMISVSGDTEQFSNLIKKTASRDGFSAHGKEYFQKFLKAFGEHAILLVAQDEKEWLAAGIFVFWKNTGTYYYGASIDPSRNKNAPTLIQWRAIQEAKKRGCTEYDFLGVAPENDPNHRLARVSTFKKKFGGEVEKYAPETYLLISPFVFFLLNSGKVLRNLFRKKM